MVVVHAVFSKLSVFFGYFIYVLVCVILIAMELLKICGKLCSETPKQFDSVICTVQ